MMKVKPFSYHIPPRRKAYDNSTTFFSATNSTVTSTTSYSSCGNSSCSKSNIRHRTNNCTSSSNPIFITTSSLSTLGSIATVLIFVLLGFIGVAGQGKLREMQDASVGTFPTQGFLPEKRSLSYKGIRPSSRIALLEDSDEDDDIMLQRRIPLMGHYGTKYRNASLSYNYSSHSPHPHHYYSEQYKLEPNFGTMQSTPRENLFLSLNEENQYVQRAPLKSSSAEINEKAIHLQLKQKLKRAQWERPTSNEGSKAIFQGGGSIDSRHTFPIITEPPTPNRTSSVSSRQNQFINLKYLKYPQTKSPDLTNSLRQYNRKKVNEFEEDEEVITVNGENRLEGLARPSFQLSSKGRQYATSDLDDYDDADALERFMPGNISHISGKLRFRQSSQAEVDESENENSLTNRRRPRRSVVHLYDMVVCSTGCNPLIFKGYGCYCGFLGSGLTVDGIDKCCAKHDWCYHHAKCPPLLTYFVPYYWRCDRGRPQCVTDFRGWKGVCGAHLCECDRQFAECLKQFPCPRSRAMCVTSPWSHMPADPDPRAFPFTVSRRLRPWRPPPLPIPPRIPLLTFPSMGRLFP